jgi:putative N6-adenine-specific DNA methylase
VDLKNPTLRINLHIMGNEVSIALDSSGDSLHKRGYRIEKSAAPLNEVLAAGMIMLTGWDRKSNFVDPMCGSGTLPIEAAWMAMNVAPGLRRDYAGFKNWKDFDDRLWRGLIEDAKSKIVEPEGVIFASEISQGAVDISRRNITRAGLLSKIELHCRDFRKIKAPEGSPGVLIANPPYGERIQVEDIEKFYEEFGDVLKKQFMGYDAWILTANQAALKRLGLKASKKIPLMNGPIECRFQKYEMYLGTREPKEKAETTEDDQATA